MYYNQANRWNGIPMPLLMGFSQPEKIREAENEVPITYDSISQIVYYDMRIVGTKCLKTSTTWINVPGQKGANSKRGQTDKKNEIDDQKNA